MGKKKDKGDFLTRFIISLGLAVLVVLLTQVSFLKLDPLTKLEQKHIDERFLKRGVIPIKDSSDVIILEITQNTYNNIAEAWPWPRSTFAKVIRNLNEAGAKAVGIDIVMSSPDKYDPMNDSAMFNVIREYGNVVVAGKVMNVEGDEYTLTSQNENFESVYFEADSSIGIVQVVSDNDGVVRRYLPFMYSSTTERLVPTFSFALLNKYTGKTNFHLAENTDGHFIHSDIEIPKYDNVSMLLNFYGPSRSFQYFDFINVLDDQEFMTRDEIEFEIPINMWDDETINETTGMPMGLKYSGIFKDKIVLIGSTMPEDKDILPISFARGEKEGDNLIYGVEIHANALQNILHQDFIVKQPIWLEVLITLILGIGVFFLSYLLKELKFASGLLVEGLNLIIVAAIFFGLREISFYLFAEFNFLFTLYTSFLAVGLGYIGSTAYKFISERKQKGMIKGMFSQYVSGAVVDDLISDPDKLQLGGERRELSVFFSDIAGFSTFSENKEPEELVRFLNEYLSAMTQIVFDNKGTLDKYIGDAVMAFWGAPTPTKDHAYLAVKSALDMQVKIAEMVERWRQEGQPLIHARMGINTGDMVVGNVGGVQRFDYTVMGDNVNLASRLEGANKEYGSSIMIADSTYEQVKDRFHTRELDFLTVKGKSVPIKVYEVFDFVENVLPEKKVKCIEAYNKGLHEYKSMNFEKAISFFEEALTHDPDDYTSSMYIKRCKSLIQDPPPADWDGVYHLKTK